jgi:predicted ATPase
MLRQPQEPDLGIYLKRDGSNAAAVLSNLKRYGSGEGQVWEILPGLLGQIAEGIVSVDKVAAGTKETLLFQQRWGGGETKNFYAISMSDGTLRALGVLLAIYQLARPSVVGIEEPEATVHPALRDMMTEVLVDAAGQRQILITTHSPELVDFKEIRDEQIRMVTLRNGHTVIAPLPESRREVIRQRLATPGELLRMGEIRPDDAEEAPESAEMDLFGPPLADASQMQ